MVPNQPFDSPNISAKPNAQKTSEPRQKSIRFFMKMFTAFFERVNPASTSAKPACMKNTRIAATTVHTTLTG